MHVSGDSSHFRDFCDESVAIWPKLRRVPESCAFLVAFHPKTIKNSDVFPLPCTEKRLELPVDQTTKWIQEPTYRPLDGERPHQKDTRRDIGASFRHWRRNCSLIAFGTQYAFAFGRLHVEATDSTDSILDRGPTRMFHEAATPHAF